MMPPMDPPAASATAGWTCGACGHPNRSQPLCARCGVSRAWLEDPPLDLPPAPAAAEQPATWLALLHGGLALLGALLLVRPEIAPYLALRPGFQAIQVAASLAATWMALSQAAFDRRFRELAVEVPEHSPADRPFVVRARLVPYRGLDGVHVRVDLVSRTYAPPSPTFAADRRGVGLRSRVVERHELLGGGRLPGRRASTFEASLRAPFPSPHHRSVTAELEASLLGAFGPLVPGLAAYARNLREHGGVWVRVTVRIGPWRRRVERRVLVHHVTGDELQVG